MATSDIKVYGTEYGGFVVSPGLLKKGGLALCAGIGEDISFDIQLMGLHHMKVVGVDPTEKSSVYVKKIVSPETYTFIPRALVGSEATKEIEIFENSNEEYVSESILSSHESIDKAQSRLVKTTTIESLIQEYGQFDLIKMDIEGAEYEVIENLKVCHANHFCVEFHHRCTGFSIQDTQNAVNKLASLGFNEMVRLKENEMTFLKVETS